MLSRWLSGFFGLNDDFVRPVPGRSWRTDWIIAAVLSLVSVATLMYMRDLSSEMLDYLPVVPSCVAILVAGVLITFRRRFPIGVLLLASGAHFVIVGVALPAVASIGGMQVLYFLGIYTAMAYARNRQSLALGVGLVLFAMVVWLVAADSYARATAPDEFQPTLWYYFGTTVLNFAYFGAAIWLGRQAWLQAKAASELATSRDLVRDQGARLAEQAVVAERLRIARDLHDSVAHHISLIGVQTAAARRTMGSHPEVAAQAMLEVESMSREAVSELRGMLGSLRDVPDEGNGARTIDGLAALADESSVNGLLVSYQLVGEPAEAQTITPMQAGQLLRIAQEAVTNIRRHSTASEARIVVRLGRSIEMEITDNGRPVLSAPGTGLGQVGIRERVAALGGTVELGPRSTVGYRVRVTLPRRIES
ncbi:Signal transduction histidine kinase [Tessaracoccus bendigoensis DSM 12906]|uniref:histidine kinase n=1 Tax=Tessaracoccus bendigoensis DSM 12906 TaxID=1123357 RepID=A0A1M6AUE9_9ACTN|nr:histidine kinase [Tessaracoccus bendigoensis]SHI40144.1 Signal transduction histidine kinase [Tessaracoccus bendigoensis DSM 12906]